MRKISIALLAAVLGAAALLVVPSAPAGSATSGCVAWASLPHRVALAGHVVYVRSTLHGTAACRGVTADAGGSATLRGPSDFPLRWDHVGATDTAPFSSLDALGTYRIRTGDLQTYDASYVHIPYVWRATSTVVKYAGRFVRVARGGGRVSATLQYYARYGWEPHARVVVRLQRHRDGAWHAVARHRSSGSGRVTFALRRGTYRLVSVTTARVWSATELMPARRSGRG
jgi:hypothetical protein